MAEKKDKDLSADEAQIVTDAETLIPDPFMGAPRTKAEIDAGAQLDPTQTLINDNHSIVADEISALHDKVDTLIAMMTNFIDSVKVKK